MPGPDPIDIVIYHKLDLLPATQQAPFAKDDGEQVIAADGSLVR